MSLTRTCGTPSAIAASAACADSTATTSAPAVGAGGRRTRRREAIEDRRQNRAAAPGAGGAPPQLQLVAVAPRTPAEGAVRRRELHGVREEFPRDLLHPLRLADHGPAVLDV